MLISVSFSPILNVTIIFSPLLNHVFDTHISFIRENSNNILPSKFLCPRPYPPWTPVNPSTCLPTCPLVAQAHNLHYAYSIYLSAHHRKLFLPLCRAYPQFNLSTSFFKSTTTVITITYPSYFYHFFTQLVHHNSHTIIPSYCKLC